MSNAAKNVDILVTSLNVLHNDFNYFHKIIFLLCIAKILDLLAKSFLSCIYSVFFKDS